MSLRSAGFTLLETIVVISILAILLVIGIPAYNNFKSNQTVRSLSDTILSDARTARDQSRSNSDGVIFAGPVPGAAPANGDTDVEVWSVAQGKPQAILQQVSIPAQFSPAGQNLTTSTQLVALGLRVGALVVFTGPNGQQVLAFGPNGSAILPATGLGSPAGALTGAAIQMKNSSLTFEIIATNQGDVLSLQNGATGVAANQQAIISIPPTPF